MQTLNSNVDDVVVVGGEVVEKQRSKLVGKFSEKYAITFQQKIP